MPVVVRTGVATGRQRRHPLGRPRRLQPNLGHLAIDDAAALWVVLLGDARGTVSETYRIRSITAFIRWTMLA
jgi:hypothetical protein